MTFFNIKHYVFINESSLAICQVSLNLKYHS